MRILAVPPYRAMEANMEGWLHDIVNPWEAQDDYEVASESLLLNKSPPIQSVQEDEASTWMSLGEP